MRRGIGQQVNDLCGLIERSNGRSDSVWRSPFGRRSVANTNAKGERHSMMDSIAGYVNSRIVKRQHLQTSKCNLLRNRHFFGFVWE